MVRKHWREPRFWKWWWRYQAPSGLRVGAGALVLALLLAGGWIAADGLSSASAGASGGSYVLETTVERVVTVREQGKLVRKVVPVIKRVRPLTQYRTETQFGTQVVTAPGAVSVRRVVRLVPKVETRVVTGNGVTRTVSETRLVPTTRVETRTRTAVVTAERTVTNTAVETRMVTNERTVTRTDTDTVLRTVTQTQTETQPSLTVTLTLPATTVMATVTVKR